MTSPRVQPTVTKWLNRWLPLKYQTYSDVTHDAQTPIFPTDTDAFKIPPNPAFHVSLKARPAALWARVLVMGREKLGVEVVILLEDADSNSN